MSEQEQRYPLSWPIGWQRTPRGMRQRAAFMQTVKRQEARSSGTETVMATIKREQAVSIYAATERLERQLELLGASAPLLSTNVLLRLDGRPRSDQREPDDPGAACYFKLKGQPRVLACDKWLRVADNIAAIAQHIDAIRRIDRYGVGTLDQAFAGYAALPENTAHAWWIVFGVESNATLEQVEEAYRRMARAAHPDTGGTHDAMARLNEARANARRALQR